MGRKEKKRKKRGKEGRGGREEKRGKGKERKEINKKMLALSCSLAPQFIFRHSVFNAHHNKGGMHAVASCQVLGSSQGKVPQAQNPPVP